MRSRPSTIQKSTGEPSWPLIRLVSPTGTTKNRPIAKHERHDHGPGPHPTGDLLVALAAPRLVLRGELRVGRDAERPQADRQGLAERDDTAHHRHPQQRWRLSADVSGKVETSISPRSRAAASSSLGRACAPPQPSWRRPSSSRPRAPPDRRPARHGAHSARRTTSGCDLHPALWANGQARDMAR